MQLYYSGTFFIIYLVFIILGIGFYFYFLYSYNIKSKRSNLNLKNIILVTDKLLKDNKKDLGEVNSNLDEFPYHLKQYIKKPTPLHLSEMLLYICSQEKSEEIFDIFRCITISSILFKKEIPLIFVKLDTRTQKLLDLITEDLKLKNVLIMSFYLEKIRDIISDKEEYHSFVDNFKDDLVYIGEHILFYNNENSYPSLDCFTSEINLKIGKDLTKQQIKSLCTAFSAVTAMKIPKSYVKIDSLSLSLIHYKKSKEHI